MRMRNGYGLLISCGFIALSLVGCDTNYTSPTRHEYAYAPEQYASQEGWEDCRVTFDLVLRGDPVFEYWQLPSETRDQALIEWLGLEDNQAGDVGMAYEGANFQECLIITFHDPGPEFDGPYAMHDVHVRSMQFYGLNGNHMAIKLIGDHGDDGIAVEGLIPDIVLEFKTVR